MKKGLGVQKKEEKESSLEKSDKVEVEGSVQTPEAKLANKSQKMKMQV